MGVQVSPGMLVWGVNCCGGDGWGHTHCAIAGGTDFAADERGHSDVEQRDD